MNVYYYTPADLGLASWPAGEMRLGGFTPTTDPYLADAFCLPPITHWVKAQLANLPYLEGRERRHVVWNVADDYDEPLGIKCLALRCDANKGLLRAEPWTKCWPWPVEDLYEPAVPFQFDVVFQGWASTPLTDTVVESVGRMAHLNTHLARYPFFYGYHDKDPDYAHYRQSFINTLRASRLSLVPRSIPSGVIRYRFYEALSAGRVPVQFNDNVVLPWPDKIDWTKCSIHIDESHADHAGEILADWLSKHTDDEIRSMGEYGRLAWQRWLNPRAWESLFGEAVKEWLNE